MSKPVKPLLGLSDRHKALVKEDFKQKAWLQRNGQLVSDWIFYPSLFLYKTPKTCVPHFWRKKHGEQHSVILSENQIPVRGVKGPSRPHRQWQISWRYFGSEGFRILERGFLEVRKRICQISWQKILYISEQRLFRRPDLVMEHKAWKNLWVYLQCIWPGISNSSKQREIHLVRRHYGLSLPPSLSWYGEGKDLGHLHHHLS